MPPAVTPASQVGRPAAAVRTQRGGDLGNPLTLQGGLDDHLRGKLHARCLQAQAQHRVSADAAKPAVEVAARAGEEEFPYAGQQGVAEVPVDRFPITSSYPSRRLSTKDVRFEKS